MANFFVDQFTASSNRIEMSSEDEDPDQNNSIPLYEDDSDEKTDSDSASEDESSMRNVIEDSSESEDETYDICEEFQTDKPIHTTSDTRKTIGESSDEENDPSMEEFFESNVDHETFEFTNSLSNANMLETKYQSCIQIMQELADKIGSMMDEIKNHGIEPKELCTLSIIQRKFQIVLEEVKRVLQNPCLLYTSPSPRDRG